MLGGAGGLSARTGDKRRCRKHSTRSFPPSDKFTAPSTKCKQPHRPRPGSEQVGNFHHRFFSRHSAGTPSFFSSGTRPLGVSSSMGILHFSQQSSAPSAATSRQRAPSQLRAGAGRSRAPAAPAEERPPPAAPAPARGRVLRLAAPKPRSGPVPASRRGLEPRPRLPISPQQGCPKARGAQDPREGLTRALRPSLPPSPRPNPSRVFPPPPPNPGSLRRPQLPPDSAAAPAGPVPAPRNCRTQSPRPLSPERGPEHLGGRALPW